MLQCFGSTFDNAAGGRGFTLLLQCISSGDISRTSGGNVLLNSFDFASISQKKHPGLYTAKKNFFLELRCRGAWRRRGDAGPGVDIQMHPASDTVTGPEPQDRRAVAKVVEIVDLRSII